MGLRQQLAIPARQPGSPTPRKVMRHRAGRKPSPANAMPALTWLLPAKVLADRRKALERAAVELAHGAAWCRRWPRWLTDAAAVMVAGAVRGARKAADRPALGGTDAQQGRVACPGGAGRATLQGGPTALQGRAIRVGKVRSVPGSGGRATAAPRKGGVTRRAVARVGRKSPRHNQAPFFGPAASPGAQAGRPERLAPGPRAARIRPTAVTGSRLPTGPEPTPGARHPPKPAAEHSQQNRSISQIKLTPPRLRSPSSPAPRSPWQSSCPR